MAIKLYEILDPRYRYISFKRNGRRDCFCISLFDEYLNNQMSVVMESDEAMEFLKEISENIEK